MKVVVLLCLAVVSVNADRNNVSHYTKKYDDFNVNRVINNDRIMLRYLKCLLDQLECNKPGSELKKVLADALETGCAKCSVRQSIETMKVIHHLINNRRPWWNALEAKYDPTGNYRKRFAHQLGITH